MEAPATFTGAGEYERSFTPRDYLSEYYRLSDGQGRPNTFLMQNLRSLAKVFALEGLGGDTLLDVGCGPTIYQLLSACERFQEIVAMDYTPQNRQELESWLRNEPGAFDWRPVVQYVCELEGDREQWAEKEAKLRGKVKRVLKCDVTKANPAAPADCVLSAYCLEAACPDLPAFHRALRGIAGLVRPGGHLVLLTSLSTTYYGVGEQVFSCLRLDEAAVLEAVEGGGSRALGPDKPRELGKRVAAVPFAPKLLKLPVVVLVTCLILRREQPRISGREPILFPARCCQRQPGTPGALLRQIRQEPRRHSSSGIPAGAEASAARRPSAAGAA
ncbi:nicotinamide N-methyltransferase [Columba livia]|uniref:Nicotinamide N-methyltransferase n=1 Tax=Columba livia TaxID=8932 RepID=A0A2I0LQD2_COLLI|nr:nicotinamide N-methyltransferase [Columba livia]